MDKPIQQLLPLDVNVPKDLLEIYEIIEYMRNTKPAKCKKSIFRGGVR